MKRQMLFGTMLSVALSIGLSAQAPQNPPAGGGQSQPPTSQPQTPRTPSDQSSSDRTMTLTGCVQAGAGAGAAAAGAGAQSGGFTLTSIKPAGSAGSSTAPGATAGTAGTSGATASSYRLTGEDLQQYVGKRVEVTGSVSARAGSSAPGAAGAGAASADSTPSFRVTSVKPATGECK